MSDRPVGSPDERSGFQQKKKVLEAIRRGQEPLWHDPQRGFVFDPTVDEALSSMLEESLRLNTPLSLIIDESHYDQEILRRGLITLVYEVGEMGVDTEMDPMNLVERLGAALSELVSIVLGGNPEPMEDLAGRLGVSPVVLSIIGGSLLQPSMIHMASQCGREYLDAWELTVCPVCGRFPSVAVKSEEEVWRFRCSYCWAEYKMDVFACPHCGSAGAENKEFLLVGDSQEFEVASCKECGRYYKIINRARLKEQVPEGLEDLYTEVLDEIAHGRGLTRLDEAAPEG